MRWRVAEKVLKRHHLAGVRQRAGLLERARRRLGAWGEAYIKIGIPPDFQTPRGARADRAATP
jgi:hypothetical protein